MQIIKNMQQYPIEVQSIYYINPIGVIFDSSLWLFKYEHPIIELGTIRRMQIQKSNYRVYTIIFLCCTLPFIYVLFTFQLSVIEKWLSFLYILLFFSASFFVKNQKYIMSIKRNDMEDIKFEVDQHNKDDAKKIARQINKHIKQVKMNHLLIKRY
jgi:Ca2+/Na+ antiporter